MANIKIGQYYPENSIIHKLDPRVKLMGTLVFIILLFQIDTIFGYAAFTLIMAGVIKASKVPFKKLLKGIRGILFILLFSVVINIFMTPGHVLVEIGMVSVTQEGLVKGGYIAVRLV